MDKFFQGICIGQKIYIRYLSSRNHPLYQVRNNKRLTSSRIPCNPVRSRVVLVHIIQNAGLLSTQLIDRNHPLHIESLSSFSVEGEIRNWSR
jgi:hypothetical protein